MPDRSILCVACSGTGDVCNDCGQAANRCKCDNSRRGWYPCSDCGGGGLTNYGEREDDSGIPETSKVCPDCDGSGGICEECGMHITDCGCDSDDAVYVCPECEGTGSISND